MAATTDFLQITVITDFITKWGRYCTFHQWIYVCAKSNWRVCIAYNKYSAAVNIKTGRICTSYYKVWLANLDPHLGYCAHRGIYKFYIHFRLTQ